MIKLTAADGHSLDAYLARPDGEAKGRVVVIQEIFGVNAHVREVCDGYAADGYTALAPAMFDRVESGVELGYDQDGMARGRAIRAEVPWNAAEADVAAARDYLAGEGPVAIVGYCWGGSIAFMGATMGGFACASGYYGGQIIDILDRKPQVPTMLHFGTEDAGIPMSDVDAIRAAHPNAIIHTYEGAGHGFNCDHRGSYDEESARIARARTLEFFAQHVG
jgi:carboxymethylenebutenolidase